MAAESPVTLSRAYTAPGGPVRPVRRRSNRKSSVPTVGSANPGAQKSNSHPQTSPSRIGAGAGDEQRPTSPSIPSSVAPPPAWARDVLRSSDPNHPVLPRPKRVQAVPSRGERLRHGDVVRAAVRVIATEPLKNAITSDDRIPPALVAILCDDAVFASDTDRLYTIAAVRALVNTEDECREALLSNEILVALVTVARDTQSSQRPIISNSNTQQPRSKVWTDAVLALADFFTASDTACAEAVECGGLALLAEAAAPSEDINLRVSAAGGLAAVGIWSGPRLAVRIVETPGVVKAMSAILTERDEIVSNQVRSATMDALVAMSFHRKARRILKDEGCDSTITQAAKQASQSGDFDFAAQGTIAAGHVNGHSVDEFGFLVLVENGEVPPSPTSRSAGRGGELRGSPITTSEKSRSSPTRIKDTAESEDDPEGQGTGDENTLSALMAFSNVTRKAAAVREDVNPNIRKSESQVNRDSQHEQFWRDVIEKHPEMLERETGKVRRVTAYRTLATVPVPSALRSTLWPILLGVPEARAASPGLYESLCVGVSDEGLNDETEHTIDADVTRTMPLHALFWAGGAQVGVQSLRSILRAYARYRPDVGYCQGMSSVAAVFMMNADNEEDAFLMFSQFMEYYQYKKVFAEGFPKMRQWLDELQPLIYHYMPDLWTHLERENVPLEIYADKWLITALSHNFPHRYLLRVWDLMFLGGSPKIILKSCLAVLKVARPKVLSLHFEGIMHLLQRDFAKPEEGLLDVMNPEPFLKIAREFRFENNPRRPPSKLDEQMNQSHPASATSRPPPNPPPPQQRAPPRRKGCCTCFGGSRTID